MSNSFLNRWFSYYKPLKDVCDFDWTGLFRVERHQLSRLLKAANIHNYYGDQDRMIKQISICIRLIDLILTDKFIKQVSSDKFECTIYVNTRNSQRFINCEIDDSEVFAKADFYILKALYLYNKIRSYYITQWWV